MNKVLLTGGTGFIGQHCLPSLLANGYEVHALSSKLVEKSNSEVQWHSVNLFDSAKVSEAIADIKPTHLLHFAWIAEPGKYWTSVENFSWVQASLNLLQEFARHGGHRVVMAGTCAEYNWQYGYCCEEITPLLPITVYGICKHSMQNMLYAFARETQISAAWGRIFFAYGPHEHPQRLVSSVICSLLQNKPARCSHGNQIRDFLYVRDVADAFASLLDSTVSGAVNIASGKPIALKDIIHQIAQKLNQIELIELGAIPAPANEPPLIVADVRRLIEEVGWQPKINLNDALDETILWWRTQGKINNNL